MSFVIIRGERFALEHGLTVLGGRGDRALAADVIAGLPPFAVIDYPVDGPTTVRAVKGMTATLNGAPLTSEPRALSHGDRLEVASLLIAFGDMGLAGRTSDAEGVPDRAADSGALVVMVGEPTPTAATGGRLTRLADGAVYDVPEGGLTIGRDPDAGVVLASRDVSRTHATITPSLLGYTLTDQSANGVLVNGARVDGVRRLGQGDVVRIGDDEFRFEADGASFEPPARPAEPPPVAAPHFVPSIDGPAAWLATLEVVSEGPLKGHCFRVQRPTVRLGRGPLNDVKLANESVSASHATLLLRSGAWHVLDLQSRNGTFVDGEVVRAQRPLPSVCELRLGTLVLVFRARGAAPAEGSGTVGVIGLSDADVRRRKARPTPA